MDINSQIELEIYFADHFDTILFPVLADIYLKNNDLVRSRKVCEIGLKHPEFDPTRIPIITQLPKDIHCMAMTSMSSEPNSAISSALVIIRSELPVIMRRACFHEEIAQSLGLTNDSHLARPSVFNDDDEFATLTKFDEILLQILYDHRLNSGISKREASQLVRQIANEINIDL